MRKKVLTALVGTALALSLIAGCGNSEASATGNASSAAAETESVSEAQSDAGGNEAAVEVSLTKDQQAIVDKVFQQLENKEYDALFADMIYPENSVVKVDDLNNFFILNLTMDEIEEGAKKEKINDRIEDGFIKFEYGLKAGGYTTVCILENADTPDGYEVRLCGFSGDLYGGDLTNTAMETTLLLPSGLTNVVVDGVPLDDYVDETYYEGVDVSQLKFDPADYTAYKVVYPCLTYGNTVDDEMAELMKTEYGFELGRYTFEVTADSAYGPLEGTTDEDGSHYKDSGFGDHEGELFQPLTSTTANDMLLVLLQKIYDKACAGNFDIDSYREFFVEGVDDAVIQELLDSLNKHFNENVGTISNLKAEEVHTYTQKIYYDVPMVEYVGGNKMDMDIGVHSSYDQTMTYSEDHHDAYQQLHLTVETDGSEVKIAGFAENSHLNNLFNYMGKKFEDQS